MTPWGVAGEFGRILADSTSLAFIPSRVVWSTLVGLVIPADVSRCPASLLRCRVSSDKSNVLFQLLRFFSFLPRYFHALFLSLTYSHALTLMSFIAFLCSPLLRRRKEGSAQALPGQLEWLHPGWWPHLTQFDSHKRQTRQPSHASCWDPFLSMVTLASSARKLISYVFDLANMDMNIHKKLSSYNFMPVKYIFENFTGLWATVLACIHGVYGCISMT